MAEDNNDQTTIAALIVGLCLLIGLITGGYFIGRGTARFKSDIRTVTVKGLVEREVKADEAVWTVNLRRAGEDLREVHAKITADRNAVLGFLKKNGFNESEITGQPPRTIDRLAREYGPQPASDRLRYVVTTLLTVRSASIELVQKVLGSIEELLKTGVYLDTASAKAVPRTRPT